MNLLNLVSVDLDDNELVGSSIMVDVAGAYSLPTPHYSF